jgi:hypothetical protein
MHCMADSSMRRARKEELFCKSSLTKKKPAGCGVDPQSGLKNIQLNQKLTQEISNIGTINRNKGSNNSRENSSSVKRGPAGAKLATFSSSKKIQATHAPANYKSYGNFNNYDFNPAKADNSNTNAYCGGGIGQARPSAKSLSGSALARQKYFNNNKIHQNSADSGLVNPGNSYLENFSNNDGSLDKTPNNNSVDSE